MGNVIWKRNQVFARVVGAILAAVAVWGLVSSVIPFKPFMLRDYDAIPPTGCPNIPLALTVHYDLVEPAGVSVRDYTILTNWIEVNTNANTPLEGFEGDFLLFPVGINKRLKSPHYRTAPPVAGRWQVYTEMVVRGRVLGWPREQILPGRVYSNVFEALSPDNGVCE